MKLGSIDNVDVRSGSAPPVRTGRRIMLRNQNPRNMYDPANMIYRTAQHGDWFSCFEAHTSWANCYYLSCPKNGPNFMEPDTNDLYIRTCGSEHFKFEYPPWSRSYGVNLAVGVEVAMTDGAGKHVFPGSDRFEAVARSLADNSKQCENMVAYFDLLDNTWFSGSNMIATLLAWDWTGRERQQGEVIRDRGWIAVAFGSSDNPKREYIEGMVFTLE